MKHILFILTIFFSVVADAQTVRMDIYNPDVWLCDVLNADTFYVDYNIAFDTLDYKDMTLDIPMFFDVLYVNEYGEVDVIHLTKKQLKDRVVVIYSTYHGNKRIID